jgi:hypothetical protein
MAQFRDSKDANLVVGAVLLIAVMVAVSVAVDTLAGKTASSPQAYSPQVEELTVSSFTFTSNNTIKVVVENNGTAPSVIAEVWINNEPQTFTTNSTVIQPKDCTEISIPYAYINGANYYFKMTSEKGTTYLFTATPIP